MNSGPLNNIARSNRSRSNSLSPEIITTEETPHPKESQQNLVTSDSRVTTAYLRLDTINTATTENLFSQQDAADKLREIKEEIRVLEKEQSGLEKEIKSISFQITQFKKNIKELTEKIEAHTHSIASKHTEIEKSMEGFYSRWSNATTRREKSEFEARRQRAFTDQTQLIICQTEKNSYQSELASREATVQNLETEKNNYEKNLETVQNRLGELKELLSKFTSEEKNLSPFASQITTINKSSHSSKHNKKEKTQQAVAVVKEQNTAPIPKILTPQRFEDHTLSKSLEKYQSALSNKNIEEAEKLIENICTQILILADLTPNDCDFKKIIPELEIEHRNLLIDIETREGLEKNLNDALKLLEPIIATFRDTIINFINYHAVDENLLNSDLNNENQNLDNKLKAEILNPLLENPTLCEAKFSDAIKLLIFNLTGFNAYIESCKKLIANYLIKKEQLKMQMDKVSVQESYLSEETVQVYTHTDNNETISLETFNVQFEEIFDAFQETSPNFELQKAKIDSLKQHEIDIINNMESLLREYISKQHLN